MLFLFAEILNKYLYFHSKGCVTVTEQLVEDMKQLVMNEMAGVQEDQENSLELRAFVDHTLSHTKRYFASK